MLERLGKKGGVDEDGWVSLDMAPLSRVGPWTVIIDDTAHANRVLLMDFLHIDILPVFHLAIM